MSSGEVGKYKVAYVTESPNVLSSDMFEDYLDAKSFIKQNNVSNYLMFKARSNAAGHYEWDLLNEGSYIPYRIGMFFRQNWLELLIIAAVILTFWVVKVKYKSQTAATV